MGAKTTYGYMRCPTPGCCDRHGKVSEVTVKENEKGTLSGSCGACDFVFYVAKTQAGFARWDGIIEKAARATPPAPAPKPAPATPPAPPAPPKPAKRGSTLLDLDR